MLSLIKKLKERTSIVYRMAARYAALEVEKEKLMEILMKYAQEKDLLEKENKELKEENASLAKFVDDVVKE